MSLVDLSGSNESQSTTPAAGVNPPCELVAVQLKNARVFKWQLHSGWYFLELRV